jgi:hypothetical protein
LSAPPKPTFLKRFPLVTCSRPATRSPISCAWGSDRRDCVSDDTVDTEASILMLYSDLLLGDSRTGRRQTAPRRLQRATAAWIAPEAGDDAKSCEPLPLMRRPAHSFPGGHPGNRPPDTPRFLIPDVINTTRRSSPLVVGAVLAAPRAGDHRIGGARCGPRGLAPRLPSGAPRRPPRTRRRCPARARQLRSRDRSEARGRPRRDDRIRPFFRFDSERSPAWTPPVRPDRPGLLVGSSSGHGSYPRGCRAPGRYVPAARKARRT